MSVYSEIYKSRLSQIDALKSKGELSALRIASQIESGSFSDECIQQNRSLKEMVLSRKLVGFPFDGVLVPEKEISMDVGINVHRVQVAGLVKKYLPQGTKRIVELGSGFGVNLLWLWHLGGDPAMKYCGFEYDEYGNRCLDALAGLVDKDAFSSCRFDYNEPDFSMLLDDVPTAVITVHSIEQIKFVDVNLINKIKSIPGFKRCIHIEPVGFQMDEGRDNDNLINYHNEAWSTLRNGYNRNLVNILTGMQKGGELQINRMQKHIGGMHVGNSSSLVVWEI
ncbi:MAG: hypothetical protein OEX19_00325 [Gammaproteobacteria bacterium]|nr:hypothetical protein [Gammaproteobacteria bacterium]